MMINILEVGLWRKEVGREGKFRAWRSLPVIGRTHDILSKTDKLEKDLITLEPNYRLAVGCNYQKSYQPRLSWSKKVN